MERAAQRSLRLASQGPGQNQVCSLGSPGPGSGSVGSCHVGSWCVCHDVVRPVRPSVFSMFQTARVLSHYTAGLQGFSLQHVHLLCDQP